MFSIDVRIGLPWETLPRAVVADGDADQRRRLAHCLGERGFTVVQAPDGVTALAMMGERETVLALLRRRDDGERAAALATMLYPRTRVLLTSRTPQPDGAEGAFPVLALPPDPDQLDRWLSGLAGPPV